MSRKISDRIAAKHGCSFAEVVEQTLRQRRLSPEELAAEFRCSVPTLMAATAELPIRIKRCMEWAE